MAANPVTPVAGAASVVTVGGTPVIAVAAGPNGGFIQNPVSAADQGNLPAAEDLVINPVGAAASPTVAGGVNGTNFRIPPGGIWQLIPGQTTNTSVNAATGGHKFSVVVY
jgi:hypothetical protein